MKTSKYTKSKSKRFDFRNLNQDEKTNFVNTLSKNLTPRQDNVTPESLIEIIQLSANESLPRVNKIQNQPLPWDDDNELKNLLNERKQYHIKYDKKEYRANQSKIHKRVTVLRNDYYANEAQKFTAAQTARDITKSYKIAKEQSNIHRKNLAN